ncbi:MAG: lamin tail domain-containing protein [Verrucomicrobia subdivision 3 bacterium]|nr:lamin tail domain-containing protein [Limisphaerales bacterium]
MYRRVVPILLGLLLPAPLLAQDDVIITEFLASNTRVLADENGEFSDWIEIHNRGTNTVNLLNWSLTDDAGDLAQWRFPSTNLASGRFMLIWASEKNRRTPGAPLHTNFRLSGGGEYLALVRPDGSIATEFAPAFPSQVPNVSYGLGVLTSNQTLVATNAPLRVFFPTESAPTNWTASGYNDIDWLPGNNGVGYGPAGATELDYGAAILATSPVAYWRLDETSGTVAANAVFGPGATYNLTTLGTAGPRSPQFGGFETNNRAPTFNGSSGYAAGPSGLLNGRSSFTICGWIRPIATPAARTGLFGQNDCVEFGFISGTMLQCWTPGGGMVNATWSLPFNNWYHVAAVGDGTNIRIYTNGVLAGSGGIATANYGSSTFNFNIAGGGIFDATGNFFNGQIDEVAVYHRAFAPAEVQSVYQAGLTPISASVHSHVRFDAGPHMSNVIASAYVRIPFNVPNPTNIALLTVRMRFDDGFAAYINGLEALRINSPETLGPESTATATHSPVRLEEYRIGASLLLPGTNVLAIHGLNIAANDVDFLVNPEVIATVIASQSSTPVYFTLPSPGQFNSGGVAYPGPAILDATHTPNVPTDAQDILVTAQITPTFNPLVSAVLRYRVMFGSEMELPLFDDGAHGDGGANDGVFAATIPASASTNGQMVRWYFRATDTVGNVSRWPLFTVTNRSAEYLGTMVEIPGLTSKLPIVHLFAPASVLQAGSGQAAGTADLQAGSGGVSVFHDGEFYDNVFVAVRGNTTAGYNKKSHRFEFNAEHPFRHSGPGPRLRNTSFVADYPDPAYMRQGLCYWLGDFVGCPSPFYIPHTLYLNGQFYQLANHNDVSGDEMLDRLGYDRNGALYNAAGQVTPGRASTGGFEKKTREWDNDLDYTALANAVSESVALGQRRTNIFDMLDLPQVINYLVTARWAHENDDVWANMSLYHDNDGDNLWRIIPFDMNLSWGAIFYEGGNPQVIEGVQSTNDIHKAHPLYGSSQTLALSGPSGGYNRIYDCIFLIPETRQMFLRRMRTMLDTFVGPIGTPNGASIVEQRILYLRDLIAEEAVRDRAKWGWPSKGGQCNFDPGINITNGVNAMLTNFVHARRNHFYGKHSVTNAALAIGITKDRNAGIPLDQSATAVVEIRAIEFNPSSGNQEQEYICITNPMPYAVDISDWELSGGVRFTFNPGTVIPTNSVLYVSPNVVAFRARTTSPRGGQGHFVVGRYQGQLSARGETLFLHDQYGRLVHTNRYSGSPSAAQTYLRITEIMYHPAPAASGPFGPEEFEYIEIKNIGPTALDLRGVRLDIGIDFNFTGSAVTNLQSNQRVLIVRNQAAFTARYGTGFNIAGQYSGALDNAGERIRLLDAAGEEILDFDYENNWYPITDGHGYSLVIVNENAPWDTWDEKASWRPSGQLNGSPGAGDSPLPNIAPIRVNELLANTDTGLDAVELYNPTPTNVNIGGWFISDDFVAPKKFRIPDGTIIPAGGYIVFDESSFNPMPGVDPSFAFSSLGDEVFIFSGDAQTNLTGYLHGYDFGPSLSESSFGTHFTSTGEEHFVTRESITLNATNTPPRIGPVIISEIMYRPPDVGGEDNNLDEFIELHNPGVTAVLWDPMAPSNTWRLDKGVEFEFPPSTTMPGGSYLLVVNFDPANTAQLNAFRSRYGVPLGVTILGPYRGELNNAGERLELLRPASPTTNEVPYVIVERVDYEDSSPWPAAADGSGPSLHRRAPSTYYNDPTNWVAALPTPGGGYAGGTAPTITSQPVSHSAVAGMTASFSVTASGSGLLYYQWRHNRDELPGQTNASLMINDVRPSDRGDYDVIVFNAAGSTVSSNAVLEILIPARILQHPGSLSLRGSTNAATYGQTFSNVTFAVIAESTSGITYQWRFNGMDIPGAMNRSITITNASIEHIGTYDVRVTDTVGSIFSRPGTLAVNVPPIIHQQPQPVTAVAGDTVNFIVTVGGTEPFGFRWRRNGVNVLGGSGFTNRAALTILNVQTNHQGTYTVIITNAGNPSPGILSQQPGATLTVLADKDGDHLPDIFEMANGYNFEDPSDGDDDTDGDGMLNYEEYTAGTDPRDENSYFRVDEITSGGGAHITFMAVSNRTYSVQFKNSLSDANWLRLTNVIASPTNRMQVIVDSGAGASRIYRLVTPYQP